LKVIAPQLANVESIKNTDFKTRLQEVVQSDTRKTVVYEVVRMIGPSNKPEFEVVVKLDDIILGRGRGLSKKKAEQQAARNAFDKMVR
jgi:ribonuclease-3